MCWFVKSAQVLRLFIVLFGLYGACLYAVPDIQQLVMNHSAESATKSEPKVAPEGNQNQKNTGDSEIKNSSSSKLPDYEKMSEYHDKLVEWLALMLAGWGIVIAAVVTVAGVVVPFALNHLYSRGLEKRLEQIEKEQNEKLQEKIIKIESKIDEFEINFVNTERARQAYSLEQENNTWARKKQLYLYNQIIEDECNVSKHYYNRGTVFLSLYKDENNSHYLDEAINDFKRSIELDAELDIAYYNLGVCYELKKEYQLALENYKTGHSKVSGIEKDDRHYYSSMMRMFIQLGKFDQALNVYDTIERKFTSSIESRYDKIFLLTKLKKYSEARTEYYTLWKLDKNNIKVLRELCFIELKLHCYDRAEFCVNRILDIEPRNYDALVDKGYLLLSVGRHAEALDIGQMAVKYKSENYRAYNLLGQINTKKNDFVAARENFSKALKCDDQKADIYHNLGTLYENDGFDDKAIEYYKKAIEVDSSFLESRNSLTRFYLKNEQYDKITSVLGDIFSIDPKNAKAHMTRIWLLSKQNLYTLEMELEECKRLIEVIHYSEASELYYSMGVLCQKMGDYETALNYLKKALKYCPYEKRLTTIQKLAYSLFKLGRAALATRILNYLERKFINGKI